MTSSPKFQSHNSPTKRIDFNKNNSLYTEKDSLSDFSYLNRLRNNLDTGYSKSSVYNKSTYTEGYKAPHHHDSTHKAERPRDNLRVNTENIPLSFHESPKAPKISFHTPSCKPLTNSNQVVGMSFRGKSIYQSNFIEQQLTKSLVQRENPKDHLTEKNSKLGDYVFKSIYNKGYQNLSPHHPHPRPSARPKDNNHFFYDNTQNESSINFKYMK